LGDLNNRYLHYKHQEVPTN